MKYRKIKITSEFENVESVLNGLINRLGEENLIRAFNDRSNFYGLKICKEGINSLYVMPREDWYIYTETTPKGSVDRLVGKENGIIMLDDWAWIDPLEGEDDLNKICLIELFIQSTGIPEENYEAKLIF